MNDATQFFNTTAGGGYEIERSLRFNSSDSAYLSRTPASAGNRKTWTWAGWVKFSDVSGAYGIFEAPFQSGGSGALAGVFEIWYNGGSINLTDSGNYYFISAAKFRDPSAWQHFTFVCDTTQATASNRFKVYHNGVQLTNTAVGTITQNLDTAVNNSVPHTIGQWRGISANAYFADVHLIDGQALDPTSFTEFDDNGVLQPKAYTGSYGTNGFHLPFSDNSTAAALGTDTSGNGNDWTVNNLGVASQGYVGVIDAPNTWAGAFDGNETGTWVQSFYSGAYTETKFIFNTPISWSSTIRVKALNYSGGGGMKINDINVTSSITSNGTNNWNSLTSLLGSSGSIFSITVYQQNTNYLRLFAVELDGTVVTGVSDTTTPYSVNNNDSLVDTPTSYGTDTGAGGEVRGNYATWNPLDAAAAIGARNGNLDAYNINTATRGVIRATTGVTTGKWYWEITVNEITNYFYIGVDVLGIGSGLVDYLGGNQGNKGFGIEYYATGGGGVYISFWGPSYAGDLPLGAISVGTVIGLALDADAGTLGVYYNGVSKGNAFVNLTQANLKGPLVPAVSHYGNSMSLTANFGQRPFAYPLSGFKALCTANLPTPTIADGSTAMDVVTYTGNDSTQTISGLNFSPDFLWFKSRSTASQHALYDIIRGTTQSLVSNSTAAEATEGGGLSTFNSDGFSLSGDNTVQGSTNGSGRSYVAWTWDAGSSTVTNTEGSITSQVRANPSAGFSVVSFTGNGTLNATVGHGLGVTPAFIIQKARTEGNYWAVYHSSLTPGEFLRLNMTIQASNESNYWRGYSSTTLTLAGQGSTLNSVNNNGIDYVAYCFAPVDGYSSFGSYTGNGNVDGPFVYTGFRPKWLMIKRSSSSGYNWQIHDTERIAYNVNTKALFANDAGGENTFSSAVFDMLSNGFKARGSDSYINASGETYIYAAFAEHPFATARAR